MTEQLPVYGYEIGEEVVVRLEEQTVTEVGRSLIRVVALPSWTIAEIVGRRLDGESALYRVEFMLRGAKYVAEVRESAIEGIA